VVVVVAHATASSGGIIADDATMEVFRLAGVGRVPAIIDLASSSSRPW
jgi:vacuolar-type H+-ATPase subunit F/Vma7